MNSDIDRRAFIRALSVLLASPSAVATVQGVPSKERQFAEATALLATLVQPEQLPSVEAVLPKDAFRDPFNRSVYRWMRSRRRRGLPHDYQALGNLIGRSRSLELRRGLRSLWTTVEDRPDAPNAVLSAIALRRLHSMEASRTA